MVDLLRSVSKSPSLHQENLERVLKTLFAEDDIITNTRKESKLVNPETGNYFEVDIWIPKLNICFEFQDSYHFSTSWYHQRPLEAIQLADNLKKSVINYSGATVVQVPYWWDNNPESLIATINFERPDVFYDNGCLPICLNPSQFEVNIIPGVGELMYASFPTSLNNFMPNDSSWWLGEKYDGIRACWNPRVDALYSKQGKILNILPSVQQSFPPMFIDSEIWFGRDSYLEAAEMRSSSLTNWSFFRLVSFDKPDVSTQQLSFEKRYKYLIRGISLTSPVVTIAPRIRCKNENYVKSFLKTILSDGGEGIICRKVNSTYELGRSSLLWKLKATRGDREALVLQLNNDKSCVLQLPNGMTFTVPAQDYKELPNRGDVVTFAYDFYSGKSVPVNPVIIRKRKDLSWDDVINENEEHVSKPLSLNTISANTLQQKPKNFWSPKKHQNIRLFFENFARKRGLDPLLPNSWYSSSSAFSSQKEAGSILSHFGGSYVKAVIASFPEINLKESKFDIAPRSFWTTTERRKYLEEFAQENNFNALIPENWYQLSSHMLNTKEIKSIRSNYNSSISSMLIHLFPEVTFEKKKFLIAPRNEKERKQLRREFFINFANKKGFDPLLARNWYNLSIDDFTNRSFEAKHILAHYYGGSLVRALMDLFPDIGLNISDFHIVPRGFLSTKENRRVVFSSYAKRKGFDALVPTNWSSIILDDFRNFKGVRSVLNIYKGSFTEALFDLFPEIGLDRIEFPVHKNYWNDMQNKKAFFERFAKDNGFDPLVAENWYKIPSVLLKNTKGSSSVLKGGLSHVLPSVFPNVSFSFPDNKMNEAEYRRKFLISFAQRHAFDPLVASNWTFVDPQKVFAEKKGSQLKKYYRNLSDALCRLFSFDPSLFSSHIKEENEDKNLHG